MNIRTTDEIGSRAGFEGDVGGEPILSLITLTGPQRRQVWTMDHDPWRIGKTSENHVVLTERTVSRQHCEIRREGNRFALRDLGSTNGTLVDGVQIREIYLRPGAIVTVGRVELRVQVDQPSTDQQRAWRFEAGLSYRETREKWEGEFEERYLRWLLGRHKGNVSAAAREASMDRKYLTKLLKKHDIKTGRERNRGADEGDELDSASDIEAGSESSGDDTATGLPGPATELPNATS